jgi:hypothetical protein
MPKNYAALNKPKKEETRAREVADLRRENHALKRKVKRLYKEVGRRINFEDTPDETPYEPPLAEATNESAFCGCDVQPTELSLAGKMFLICPDCKARKKI